LIVLGDIGGSFGKLLSGLDFPEALVATRDLDLGVHHTEFSVDDVQVKQDMGVEPLA
jgi:hypothetical protein